MKNQTASNDIFKPWRGLTAASLESADVALFGICADEHCSVMHGAAQAPKILRECSAYLPPVDANQKPITLKLFDLGDVLGYNETDIYKKTTEAFQKDLTIVLGGDHSVSIFTQKAFHECRNRVGLIHIDAHADICDDYDGSKLSHACVVRRALENGFDPKDVVMIGIRSYELQEVEFLQHNDILVLSSDYIIENGCETVLKKLYDHFIDYNSVYISFDIDVVDPAYAPGTGTPEAMGIAPRDAKNLLCGLIKCLPVKVIDFVEVSPPLDCNNLTSWLTLKLLLEILSSKEDVLSSKHNRNDN